VATGNSSKTSKQRENDMNETTWERKSSLGGAAILVLALALVFVTSAQAEVRLPKIFGSHMVLQQDQPVTIWAEVGSLVPQSP
jgi:hypothetical protein